MKKMIVLIKNAFACFYLSKLLKKFLAIIANEMTGNGVHIIVKTSCMAPLKQGMRQKKKKTI